jgi:demethylmenaquinone methyltransferase/2-methoxy-6-polyprenyl-1,4-benzoquinol methylase
VTIRFQSIFSDVASTYDLTNHILTLGLDILWRRTAARAAAARGGNAWLDVCCGPAEMTRSLAALAPAGTLIVGADFTPAMIRVSAGKRGCTTIRFVVSEAARLPFPDNSFDLVTVSFATRNINTGRAHLLACFGELRRLLRPGGTFLNLDTSQPPCPLVRAVFRAYVKALVLPIGTVLSGSRGAYAYLASSIIHFHDAWRLSEIIHQAGFGSVTVRRLSFGMAAIHLARKEKGLSRS